MSAYSVAMNRAICDSISLEPFEDAQMVNCSNGHSFSLESVQQIFGRMQADGQCETPGPCPLCQQKVTTYVPNRDLQSVVDTALKTPVAPQLLYRKLTPKTEYPLGRSTFTFKRKCEEKSMSHWKQTFEYRRNENEQHTGIASFSIVTYPNGSVGFAFHFLSEESKMAMKKYLKEQVFLHDDDLADENRDLSVSNLSFAKGLLLIRLLREHNDFTVVAADSLVNHRDYIRRLSTV